MHPTASGIYALLSQVRNELKDPWMGVSHTQADRPRPIYTDGDVTISIFSECNVMMSAIQSADG